MGKRFRVRGCEGQAGRRQCRQAPTKPKLLWVHYSCWPTLCDGGMARPKRKCVGGKEKKKRGKRTPTWRDSSTVVDVILVTLGAGKDERVDEAVFSLARSRLLPDLLVNNRSPPQLRSLLGIPGPLIQAYSRGYELISHRNPTTPLPYTCVIPPNPSFVFLHTRDRR